MRRKRNAEKESIFYYLEIQKSLAFHSVPDILKELKMEEASAFPKN
jgi:hypothetical protein